MFTIFSRIVHYGFANFWRNGWPSAATVAIMVLALMVLVGLIFFNVITDFAVEIIQDKIDIAVYFKAETPEDEILNIKQSLESLSEVKEVSYTSSDRALEEFQERRPDYRQVIGELGRNPLLASLDIKAQRPDQYATIAEYLTAPNLDQYFESVTYHENKVVIDRLIAILNNVNRGGLVLTIILAVVAGLVVFNTIRLAIYSSREEISIMRAVGASNALVRGPFVVEGVIAGVIAAVISIIVSAPLIYMISPYFSDFVAGLDIFAYFYSHLPSLLFFQIVFGVLIGGLSSFFAVRRYLHN